MYDYAFLGGGLASLQLARKISEQQQARIVIIEKDTEKKNDRTWCFWAREAMEYDEIVSSKWSRCRFISLSGKAMEKEMAPWSYRQIRSGAFYESTLARLEQKGNFTLLYDEITDVHEYKDHVEIKTSHHSLQAKTIFDSRINFRNYTSPAIDAFNYATQHFYGLFIQLNKNHFDPETFTMMDFSYPALDDEFGFVYILPYTERYALVELTFFSNKLREDEEYHQILNHYIKDRISEDFEILETERGRIPMLDRRIRRHNKKRIIKTGTNGGLTKVSTGYTFTRVLADSEKLAHYLRKHSTFRKYEKFCGDSPL